MDVLKISPQFDADDWRRVDLTNPADRPSAVRIVRDRLEGRFLKFANQLLSDPFSGFIVLAIDCLLAETLQQFREGLIDGDRQSARLIKEFLAGRRFQPSFDSTARSRFYRDIRCGLLHQAEAKEMWLVKRRRPEMLEAAPAGRGYIIDVERFHRAVCDSLDDYCADLVRAESEELRANLWKKMNHICSVREARGVTYEGAGHQDL